MRYRVIKFVHIEVKLMYDHEGTNDWDVTKRLLTPTIDDNGKVNIEKNLKG